MAEHPEEVADISSHAGALVFNLGNISDSRMEAMRCSAYVAGRPVFPLCWTLQGRDAAGFGDLSCKN